jgi:hypothetical protein
MRSLILAGVVSAVLAPTAFANPKYTRKQDLPIEVKPTSRVKPVAQVAKPHGPDVSADDILAIEDKAEPLRKEQQAILIQLVNDTPDTDPDKPDYLFRLAEQYALQLRHWRLRSAEAAIRHE